MVKIVIVLILVLDFIISGKFFINLLLNKKYIVEDNLEGGEG
jgi:hypothetical protein